MEVHLIMLFEAIQNNQLLYPKLGQRYGSTKIYSFIIHNIPTSSFDLHLLRTTLEITQSPQITLNLLLLQQSKGLVPTHYTNLHTARLHLSLVARWFLQSSQTMQHELVHIGCFEWSEVSFQVGSGRLWSCSDRVGIVLIVVSTWTSFKQMRPIFIHSCHKQSYSVWSFRSLLSFNLRFCITISLLSAILKINLFNGWFDP